MREYKFRLWDKEKEIMLDVEKIDFDDCYYGGEMYVNTTDGSDYWNNELYSLMQYTGLHDKNGKEIWEGDIVKISEKNNIAKHKVISMKPIIAEISWSEEYLAYILITTSAKDVFENLADYLDDYDIEKIGNIYENKELLNETNR